MTRAHRLPEPTEAEILRACLAVLGALGVFAWRNNTGAVAATHRGRRRFVRFGLKGASDILGILPDGRFLAVEVKRPGGRPTVHQRAFLEAVRRQGGVALCVDRAEDLERAVRAARAGGA